MFRHITKTLSSNSGLKLSKSARAASQVAHVTKPRSVSVLNPPETILSTLDNGVRVGTENLGGSVCTVGIWLDIGSRNELPKDCGSSFILENLFFQGTEKRSKSELAQELGKLTYSVDAYTGREQMAIYALCYPNNVAKTLEILGEMVLKPNFSVESVDAAKKEVVKSLAVEADDPALMCDHYLHSMAYQKIGLENPPHGRYSNVANITPETLSRFHHNQLKGSRFVVAGAGNIEHGQLSEISDKLFSSITNEYIEEVPDDSQKRYVPSYCFHREDSWPYCYAMHAIEGPGWEKIDDCITMHLAMQLMGDYNRAKEAFEVSRHRLPHRVGWYEYTRLYDSFYHPYKGTGLWGCYFITKPDSAYEFAKNMGWEWRYLGGTATQDDAKRGQALLKAELYSALETTPTVADEIGRQLLRYGRRIPLPEIVSKIESVDADKLNKTCYDYVYDRDPVLVSFGSNGEHSFRSWGFYKSNLSYGLS